MTRYPRNGLARFTKPALIAVCLVCVSPSVAAKMYKWVDEQGNTHYTQTPPPKSAQQGKQLNVHTGSAVTVQKKGRKYYCGKHALPKVSENAAAAIARLQDHIARWEENIIRSKENREKYIKSNARRSTRSSFSAQLREHDREIAQRECQIKWGKQKLASFDDEKASIVKHHEELETLREQVERQKISACGTDSRTGVIVVDDAYREYKRCVRPFDRELRKLKGRIRTAQREAKLVSED